MHAHCKLLGSQPHLNAEANPSDQNFSVYGIQESLLKPHGWDILTVIDIMDTITRLMFFICLQFGCQSDENNGIGQLNINFLKI